MTAIAGHILAHKLETVTNRDVQRGDRTMRGLRDFEIKPLLEQLDGERPVNPTLLVLRPAWES